MKRGLSILGTVAVTSVIACATEVPTTEVGAPESTATAESELGSFITPVRPSPIIPIIPTIPTAPIVPTTPVSTNPTLDAWRARCGQSPKAPAGVIVPRETWTCPTIAAGPGAYVGIPGWQYIADAHAAGVPDAAIMALSPDLTPAMVSLAQPFCAYGYALSASATQANNAVSPISVAATHIGELEAGVGASVGPICIVEPPQPDGVSGCPTCWWKNVNVIPIGVIYPPVP